MKEKNEISDKQNEGEEDEKKESLIDKKDNFDGKNDLIKTHNNENSLDEILKENENEDRKKEILSINYFQENESEIKSNIITEQNEELDEFLKDNKNRFNHVNPLRIRKSIYIQNKEIKKKKQRKSKKKAIEELVTNLKCQYILFNIKDFIRKYQIKQIKIINTKTYKAIRIIRNTCLYIYGIVILFERPWYCYEGTTIPLPNRFSFIENCDEKIGFTRIPFMNNNLLRSIELIQTIIIGFSQILKYRDEYRLKFTNTGVNKYYNIVQIILLASLFFCLIDLILSLINRKFPIFNFLCRPFIYIYMIKRLRNNWVCILKVIWKTKKVYLFLSANMISFGVIGYILFQKDKGFFETFGESVLQLYILLSTCNFPDIMLEAMKFSKFAIIYFVSYITINYFVILSYLKSLYTTKYYEVNKRDCLRIIKDIIENEYNKFIYKGKKFNKFILSQKKEYKLSDEEFDNILILFNLYDQDTEEVAELTRLVYLSPEKEVVNNTKCGKYILDSVYVEILINILCIIGTVSLFSDNINLLIFHFVFSLLLFYEPIMLIKYLGIKRCLKHHFNRVVFHIFNFSVFICVIYLYVLTKEHKDEDYSHIFNILSVLISLRTIRLFVFLDKFGMIKNIYIIVRVSKEMLYRNLLLLYSFILLFSTISILLTGGNIKKNSFDQEDDNIPANYVYINFNDFASSYIACFCLIMINNLNILVKSLTFQSSHMLFFEFYFATFYFFSTLILINIIQTLLLELYLISDYSLKDSQLKLKEEKEAKNEKTEIKKQ